MNFYQTCLMDIILKSVDMSSLLLCAMDRVSYMVFLIVYSSSDLTFL